MDSSCEFSQEKPGRRPDRICLVVGLAVLLLPIAACHAQQSSANVAKDQQKVLNVFLQQAKQYISTEHKLPADKLKPTTDIAELERERVALRQAMQQARPNAKQGDLFTPPVAAAFRQILAQTMSGPEGAKIRASLAHAEPGAPAPLVVNGVYPDGKGQPLQSVPPTLLLKLPVLPKGLEYRIAGKTLSLRDADANMVVDLLPNALP